MPVNLYPILANGEIDITGRFMLGSNYTFLVQVRHADQQVQAVYKPLQGEHPLWDFPNNTLALREVAAYMLNDFLGWDFVPLTLLREEAPYGPGSLQQFIPHASNDHYFNFSEEDKERLRPVALFDLLINNADRKGSHILIAQPDRKLWLIDHGLCFHREDKLRTVIWDFAGEEIPAALLADVEHLHSALTRDRGLPADLEAYLSPEEIAALDARAARILTAGIFPFPPEDRRAFPFPPL